MEDDAAGPKWATMMWFRASRPFLSLMSLALALFTLSFLTIRSSDSALTTLSGLLALSAAGTYAWMAYQGLAEATAATRLAAKLTKSSRNLLSSSRAINAKELWSRKRLTSISSSVTQHRVDESLGTSVYRVEVRGFVKDALVEEWSVWRRYNEFLELKNESPLIRSSPEIVKDFPPKIRTWSGRPSERQLALRARSLHRFVRAACVKQRDKKTDPAFRKFFDLNKDSSTLSPQ